jgi:hypothetical protein
MSKLAYAAAALLALPAPALAQIVFDDSPPPAAHPAKGVKKTDADKVVCRSVETIGSRLERHQTCLTADQWRTYEQTYKDEVADIQSKAQAPSSH